VHALVELFDGATVRGVRQNVGPVAIRWDLLLFMRSPDRRDHCQLVGRGRGVGRRAPHPISHHLWLN